MPLDDTALLERWTTRRDAEAFDEIVRRFADQVYGTCKRILRNDADAEEVAQECFLLLVRSGAEVRSSLGGWLHRAATTRSLDRIRSEASRRARERTYTEASSQVVETSWSDIQEHVDAAIDRLPESTRDMIVAHFLGRKTHAEIASEQRMNRRAVSLRIQRGLDAIRRELGRRGVTVAATALGAFFAANACAAPPSLKASLGKLAIAAGTTGQVSGTVTTASLIGSLLIMKTKLAFAVVVLALLGVGAYVISTRHEPDAQAPTPVASAAPAPVATLSSTPSIATAPETEKPSTTTVDLSSAPVPLDDLLTLSRQMLEELIKEYPPIEKPGEYASITGSVVDQAGYPVASAEVSLVPSDAWGVLPGAVGLSRVVRTDARGIYEIDGIDHGGRFWVSASKPGYADSARGESSSAPINIEPGKKAAGIDFTLFTGITVQGRLLTTAGEPVPDAILHTLCVTGPGSAALVQNRSARTDASGHFAMGFEDEVRGFVVALRAQSTKYGATTFGDVLIQDEKTIELRMSGPSVIQGTIKYKNGHPIPGALLNFYGSKKINLPDSGGDEWRNPSSAGYFMSRCDTEGRYAVTVDAGLDFDAEVRTSDAQQIGKRETITALAPGETRDYSPVIESDFATVRATVVGMVSGKPFEFYVPANVVAIRDGLEVAYGQFEGPNASRITLTGSASTYTFQARYMFNNDVKGDPTEPYEIAPGDNLEIEVKLPEPQRFTVRALDAQGNPVAGAAVHFITTTSGTFDPRLFTGEDGRLERAILLAPECGARMWLEKPGFANAWGTLFEDQSPGTVHPEDEIIVSPGAGFEGDLLGTDGKALANTALSITVYGPNDQTWPLQTSTDAAGHFTIVDQAPSEVVGIVIAAQEGDSGSWRVEQVKLESNTITALGSIKLVAE